MGAWTRNRLRAARPMFRVDPVGGRIPAPEGPRPGRLLARAWLYLHACVIIRGQVECGVVRLLELPLGPAMDEGDCGRGHPQRR